MPPEPSRVWLVREGDPRAIEGILSLEDSDLTFVPSSGSEALRLSVERLRKLRRRRGTPLLTCTSISTADEEKLMLYFWRPPPLPGERPDPGVPMLLGPRGLERSAAALTLRQANRLFKDEIDGWVRALRAAGAA